jgi:hypothetical protein
MVIDKTPISDLARFILVSGNAAISRFTRFFLVPGFQPGMQF